MICAYYDKSCDSHSLFDDLKISKSKDYESHLNKYNVIYLDMTSFIDTTVDKNDIVSNIHKRVILELCKAFPIETCELRIPAVLDQITLKYNEKFYFIIDEYDAIYRQYKDNF